MKQQTKETQSRKGMSGLSMFARLLICMSLALLACSSKPHEQNSLTQEERELCIKTLSLYLQSDSITIAETNQIFQSLWEQTNPGEEIPTYYIDNIVHVDSVIHKAIGLAEQGNAEDLLTLLEQERPNIYSHPCNSIDNEMALHNMHIQLYNKIYKEGTEEYYSKIIELMEFSKIHILGLLDNKQYTPYFLQVMSDLAYLYLCADRHTEAIQVQKELCEFTKSTSTGQHIWCVLTLGILYEELDMAEQQDSCINSVKHLPGFEEIYEEFKNQF